MEIDDTKNCTQCRVAKPLSEFYIEKKRGIRPCCKQCDKNRATNYRRKHVHTVRRKDKKRSKIRYKNNRTAELAKSKIRWIKNREKYLLENYGINLVDFNRLLAKNNGNCHICNKFLPTRWDQKLDHNHTTNQVRGILCSTCNTGIGQFLDNPTLLDKAANYLRNAGMANGY